MRDLERGTMVAPNLRLTEPLGQGGMASVWVAEHLGLDTLVAVKFIAPEVLERSPASLQRFRREASIAAKIKSPHVVQVFDHGCMDDGTPYIVMELLEGESLADRLERETLSLNEAGVLLSQVAEVLTNAHERGIIHRDLKPDNLFLIRSGYQMFVKVLDFGIAKHKTDRAADGVTSTGTMMGTPSYMSPELIHSAKDATHQADLWALAIVLYEALTGVMPFNGKTLGSLFIVIDAAQFVPPSELMPELAPLDAWFERALSREPEQRFSSAQEMADGFHAALPVPPSMPSQPGLTTRTSAPVHTTIAAADTLVSSTSDVPTVHDNQPPPIDPLMPKRLALIATAAVCAGFLIALVALSRAEPTLETASYLPLPTVQIDAATQSASTDPSDTGAERQGDDAADEANDEKSSDDGTAKTPPAASADAQLSKPLAASAASAAPAGNATPPSSGTQTAAVDRCQFWDGYEWVPKPSCLPSSP